MENETEHVQLLRLVATGLHTDGRVTRPRQSACRAERVEEVPLHTRARRHFYVYFRVFNILFVVWGSFISICTPRHLAAGVDTTLVGDNYF